MLRCDPDSSIVLVLVLALQGIVVAAPKAVLAPAANTPVADAHQWDIPQSVFQIPSNPKEGRDPFFPNAVLGPKPVTPKAAPVVDVSAFVLNGITSPPKRTAMINSRTFEPGESGEVKTPGGAKVMIKCLEIRSESFLIEVAGQRQELKMRFGV